MRDKIIERLRKEKSPVKGVLNNKNLILRKSEIVEALKREKSEIYRIADNLVDHKKIQSVINHLREEGEKYYQPVLDVSQIQNGYYLALNDKSVQNPFVVSSGLVGIIRDCTREHQNQEKKARVIYDWIEQNIKYGKGRYGYSNSKEVLEQKLGVCGEMAFLYITMVRSVGLDAAFVEVDRDGDGKKVSHACAIVDVGDREILVDPAYHQFDVHHRDWKVLTDLEVLERFNQWRN